MLADFVKQVPNFAALTHAEKVKHFVWYLQTGGGKTAVRVSDVRVCYSVSDLDLPGNLQRSMDALAEKRPPDLLKSSSGYRLHATALAVLNGKYGRAESTVMVERALAELPAKLSNASEREFLEETLTCYRHHAFRATIVMVWNLAYDHLMHWILNDPARLSRFNQGIPKRNPKKSHVSVEVRADFEELKEDEVVDIASHLTGISDNMKRSLKEKLGRRNMYAHPSTMVISKPQVDDMITDLVNNVILKLPT